MFLVDTNVISEPLRPRPDPSVLSWFSHNEPQSIYLSVITLGEIRRGIEMVRERRPRYAETLKEWLVYLEQEYNSRTMPVYATEADEWGRMTADSTLPHVDLLLAATARVHGLTLVTRNTRHVAGFGIRVVNPFSH